MRMFEKCARSNSFYWVLGSIVSTCVGIACRIVELEIYAQQYATLRLNDSGLYRGLGLAVVVFPLASLILGVTAVVLIFINWKARKISGIAELFILVIGALFLFGSYFVAPEFYRIRRAISNNMFFQIRDIGSAINQYSKKYNHMPDTFGWCDSLINEPNIGLSKHDFHIGQLPHIECNFAFNANIDKLPQSNLNGNVVLLFEADGNLNLSGGPELINKERAKDKYFLFKKERFIYVLFVDVTLVKYRLHDGAIAKYDPERNKFTPYLRKGQTPYSPLRWTP